ncbi:hypothetical protein BO70DRAFT_366455 [Aspergillus heteromorphus CBS 117.55]|uniref:SMP-LTD domain-containing protein n=1 Tax=Aspergillus heteromorphus CBS 117.55 TaxID=1448321 RepID=A0A317UXK0_9EURO|nr:uncharacterized protein BO70DRAFT_366455 [Aspergillus heteromorphus CBS 117.55]PWY66763.1 hypothetical protein BO70DRAFT_366455 [Aspergillus heteromorphus CBS 117.55]
MGKATLAPEPVNVLEILQQTYDDSRIIVVVCLAAWCIGRLELGFTWLFIVLGVCRAYAVVSSTRVQRIIRDECRRYHARKILADGETVEWVNGVMQRFWHMYQDRICEHLVQYVNNGLARRMLADAETTPSRKVVMHSLALIDLPLRFTRVFVHSKPLSPNLIVEGQFQVNIAPHPSHRHLVERTGHPLIDLTIVHDRSARDSRHRNNDLAVQVRQFSSTGSLRVELDLEGAHPFLLQPHIELQEHPKMDCTIKSISQHHFPLHFAHQVDWRRVVEMQLREGLGWAFRRPLPLLPFSPGERWLLRVMTWWWHTVN